MFVLRCTKKLLQRLGPLPATPKTEPPQSTTRLGDWFANLLIIRRQRLVLGVSGITLLPLVLPAAPFRTVPARIAEGVGEVLGALGIDQATLAAEVAAMNECVVTTTNSRQVLGMMNDFANMLDFYLSEGTLLDAALKLADTPCSPLGMDSPDRATCALFAKPGLRLVKG